jgi:SulP family sulfate permease
VAGLSVTVRPAIGVLLIGFAEGLGTAKTYATKAGYEVNANRELAGLGAANLGSGLSSGWSSMAACQRLP